MRGKHDLDALGAKLDRLIPAHAGKTNARSSASQRCWAHPRACGENGNCKWLPFRKWGSSPRMRGKLLWVGGPLTLWGLIPAHAGKTRPRDVFGLIREAHPRACGENVLSILQGSFSTGSSPRMRGKLTGGVRTADQIRLIPAHAGKTEQGEGGLTAVPAHPRACGENVRPLLRGYRIWGSSPRMRGKLPCIAEKVFNRGLIPAHAGKTSHATRTCIGAGAHPRACGENWLAPNGGDHVVGSSPRMRGKHYRIPQHTSHVRLIPAHAGKTPVACSVSLSPWAHPRACGENVCPSWFLWPWLGSSPRMRGKLLSPVLCSRLAGLIPAHAGKTHKTQLQRAFPRAHPRACGENVLATVQSTTLRGSSPRMRGKHNTRRD